jgi:uncharacterized protein (TIGR00251 family)
MNKEQLLEKLAKDSQIFINVKAFPGSGNYELSYKPETETFLVKIKAAADKGRANNEIIKLLSQEFNVAKENIKILSGKTDRNKLIKLWNSQ